MKRFSFAVRLCRIVALGALLAALTTRAALAEEPSKLDVNDVTFLWPAPATPDDVSKLIAADEKLTSTADAILPAELLDKLLAASETVQITGSSGTQFRIEVPNEFKNEFKNAATWKVAGIRFDGSAPGAHAPVIALFGSKPQVRLILQPVTVKQNTVTIHDFAIHLVFDYASPTPLPPALPNLPPRAVPDREKFGEIVNDLVSLKKKLAAAGISTNVPLNVHPGLANRNQEFADGVRALLKKHLSPARVNSVAFMGIKRPEPWIFYAMTKVNGEYQLVNPPTAPGQKAQMFTNKGGDPVVPLPKNRTFGDVGVSTAALLVADAKLHLDDPALPGVTNPQLQAIKRRDIPDLIASPERSHFFTTDCVSCHTESAVRPKLGLTGVTSPFTYKLPEGVSGVADEVLPKTVWNTRNLGWFQGGGAPPAATVTHRTANEAAESVDYINREYLGAGGEVAAEPESVAHPLTLVMKVKSPEAARSLKKLLKDMADLPPEVNPLDRALTKLGNVHYARFVFLTDELFAVITTYDGEFDLYVDMFVDEIGPIFDQMLVHIADAPPLPVSENREAFATFVRDRDLKSFTPFYSAYPKLKTQDVLTLQKRAQEAAGQ